MWIDSQRLICVAPNTVLLRMTCGAGSRTAPCKGTVMVRTDNKIRPPRWVDGASAARTSRQRQVRFCVAAFAVPGRDVAGHAGPCFQVGIPSV